ncbi:unnamed protein product [Moneuplotes crassus]|uniref:Myb-like protein L n=1 Tax=Euplotes crassus TaxID=5936 RepID=A0AAD1UAX0_EUPCR|nr:unnamed protein product [Moneuplotes crassus]
MNRSMTDLELLELINRQLEENHKKQVIVKQNITKADRLYSNIMKQSNYVDNFKQDMKAGEVHSDDQIYYEKYAPGSKQECFYFKFLAKANEYLAISNEDESLNQERSCKSNNMTPDGDPEYEEFSDINTGGYRKRQRHQLSQKFKSKNKYKFKPAEDKVLLNAIEANPGNEMEALRNLAMTGPRKLLELYKRHKEIEGSHEVEWTDEEREKLKSLILKYGERTNWFQISMNFDNKNSYHCFLEYKKMQDNNIKKGKWSVEEDIRLSVSLKVYGEKNWALIAKSVPNRTDVQCRERYCNILDPRIHHSDWTEEEDERLRNAYEINPDKWSKIATSVSTRTDNQCRRRWTMLNNTKSKPASKRAGAKRKAKAESKKATSKQKSKSNASIDTPSNPKNSSPEMSKQQESQNQEKIITSPKILHKPQKDTPPQNCSLNAQNSLKDLSEVSKRQKASNSSKNLPKTAPKPTRIPKKPAKKRAPRKTPPKTCKNPKRKKASDPSDA